MRSRNDAAKKSLSQNTAKLGPQAIDLQTEQRNNFFQQSEHELGFQGQTSNTFINSSAQDNQSVTNLHDALKKLGLSSNLDSLQASDVVSQN